MEKVIEVNGLKREFIVTTGWVKRKKKKVLAVDGVSFDVKKGEIFGILGENGAGKTTIIKTLITLLAPTEGTCRVLGYDTDREAKKIRPRINFVFGGEMGVYRRLSAKDNLLYFAGLYKIGRAEAEKRAEELLKLVKLEEAQERLTETYSKGMIQRLQIARGLINRPEIIFMDEPTVGLDPLGAQILREIILQCRSEGRTIILTTHDMQEADELCDRIAMIHRGRLADLDTPERLKEKYGEDNGHSTLKDVFLTIAEGGTNESAH